MKNDVINKLKQDGPTFDLIERKSILESNTTYLLGFPFDGTASFQKGTKDGPDSAREVSFGLESYSPYQNKDIEDYKFVDLGNLPVGNTESIYDNWLSAVNCFNDLCDGIDLKKENISFLTIGGEHSISYAPIKKYLHQFSNLQLIHLDAHADLRDGYEGYKYSHASIIRRVLDHFGSGHKLFQYGIRSGTKEEFQWMRENNTLFTDRTSFLLALSSIPKNAPVYITLDIDFFDPSFVPGTGTPEPGGETFNTFIEILKSLKQTNIVGADVVELSPKLDYTVNSSIFTAKIIRELLLAIA